MDTILSESIGFNPAPATQMHIDLNSCFASIEQQANPLLRGKPVAVAAYPTGGGCILAASREAKRLGIKTGMRVAQGKAIASGLHILPPDPAKYRYINRKLLFLLQSYTDAVEVKSIDEMVLNMATSHAYMHLSDSMESSKAMYILAGSIKKRIADEIGEWLTVSIGISTNRYLAKVASGLHKPDGLDSITHDTVQTIFSSLTLEDLCGIKSGYGARLRMRGISTPLSMYASSIRSLINAFSSIVGYHWWLRLHGWEADDRECSRKSFGQSFAFGKQEIPSSKPAEQILCQLCEKMARRMRHQNYGAYGIHVVLLFRDGSLWHKGIRSQSLLISGNDCFTHARRLTEQAPEKIIRILAVSVFRLADKNGSQLALFSDDAKKSSVLQAVDSIVDRWGDGSIFPATLLSLDTKIIDRISFGGVKELEEFLFQEPS